MKASEAAQKNNNANKLMLSEFSYIYTTKQMVIEFLQQPFLY